MTRPRTLTIVGIDPGSVRTGYGVIKTDGVRSFHVAHGHWYLAAKSQDTNFNARIGKLYSLIDELVREYLPDEACVEQVFVSHNAQSALKLGHARGAVVAALVNHQLPVHEYAARSVKQAVTGSGRAGKEQVAEMMMRLLHLPGQPQADAADALAIALCHAHSRHMHSGLSETDIAGSAVGTAITSSRRRSRRWRALPGGVNSKSESKV